MINSNKELWIKTREAFIIDHDREPTDEEMNLAFVEALGDQIESARFKEMNCGDVKRGWVDRNLDNS